MCVCVGGGKLCACSCVHVCLCETVCMRLRETVCLYKREADGVLLWTNMKR